MSQKGDGPCSAAGFAGEADAEIADLASPDDDTRIL